MCVILFMTSSIIGGILALIALWHKKAPPERGLDGLEASCLDLPMIDYSLDLFIVDHRDRHLLYATGRRG